MVSTFSRHQSDKMLKPTFFSGLLLGLSLTLSALAAELAVIDPQARFPEGPVWHAGALYYVEYGGHTVKRWDGQDLSTVWTQAGCGPVAVAPVAETPFLVTCYTPARGTRSTPAVTDVARSTSACTRPAPCCGSVPRVNS